MLETVFKTWSFAKPQHPLIIKTIIANVLKALFSLCDYFAIYLVFDAVLQADFEGRVLLSALGLIAVGIVGRCIADSVSMSSVNAIGFTLSRDKRLSTANRLRYAPMGFFATIDVAELTTTLTTMLDEVEYVGPVTLVDFISGIIGTVLMCVFVLAFDWRIGLIALATVVLYFSLSKLQQKALAPLASPRNAARQRLVGAVLEYLQGIQVVKAFNLVGQQNQAMQTAIEENRRRAIDISLRSIPWMTAQAILLALASVAVAFCTILFYLGGSLDLPTCLFLLILSFVLFRSLDFAGSTVSLLKVVDTAIEEVKKIEGVPLLESGAVCTAPSNHDIAFENVRFSYQSEPGEATVIRNASAAMPAGSTTALVGRSGSGKSTLAHLIPRFWDVDDGRITIGGVDVRDYDYDTLLSQVSMVFQNVYLFNDTVEANIRFGRADATHDEVIQAAKRAQCHEFIEALPQGYDTVIGEGGSSLSGGERQRISIARALLKDAPVVILDEATASIDPENELAIMQALHELMKGKTCIMIAHRLNTVRKADQILVVDEGRIVQRGTHSQLMSEPGIYSHFIDLRKQAAAWEL